VEPPGNIFQFLDRISPETVSVVGSYRVDFFYTKEKHDTQFKNLIT
jgi:hypothetical protein